MDGKIKNMIPLTTAPPIKDAGINLTRHAWTSMMKSVKTNERNQSCSWVGKMQYSSEVYSTQTDL